MEQPITNYCSKKTNLNFKNCESVLKLLFEENCTVPFIARYRKEATGNLDETQIRAIENFYNEYIEIEKRRAFILSNLEKQESLTIDLKKIITAASTLAELEEIYAPFKSKKKTLAQKAHELGLTPLANEILTTTKTIDQLKKDFKATDLVKTWDEALEGAQYIIIEKIAFNLEIKEHLRIFYKNNGNITSKVKKSAKEIKDYLKFKDYFEFSEPILKLLIPKNSHRFLAMIRGKNQKILKVSLEADFDEALSIVKKYAPIKNNLGLYKTLLNCAETALKKNLHPSFENEFLSELKDVADEAAINVFNINLKNLLLAPYLGQKTVMGIDPGIRTGCKIVVLDSNSKLLHHNVIYLEANEAAKSNAKKLINQLITTYKIENIAIGDGTYGRETLLFLEGIIDSNIKATLVSEAGASIYSASETAIEEFPDLDVTVRGAISIARRFQDPLSELVKIDPKSIGVGQYQHDINQSKLKKSLTSIVEDCVNYVGVDLNTASYHILSYISGIGPTLAKNIVSFRQKKGGFKKRSDLLKVGRFSEKIYEQAAGFLRIYHGVNPLDGTFVHPERYPEIESWVHKKSCTLKQLITEKNTLDEFKKDTSLKEIWGGQTFKDIIYSLTAPSQDPRDQFKSTEFKKGLKDLSDVEVGQWYTGVVNNITNFGAFVNIGIKESGLVHVSQLADHFVSDPLTVVKVGQELKVKVLEVDINRKRLALSCKKN